MPPRYHALPRWFPAKTRAGARPSSATEKSSVLGVAKKVCGTASVFIGLSDEAKEKDWKWSDGSPYSCTSWNKNEPNNCCGREDFVKMSSGGGWNDVGAKSKANCYVCERPAYPPKCTDGIACTKRLGCNTKGQCAGIGPINCDDGNQCTTDSCDKTKGCQHQALLAGSCDDGNACTVLDICSGGICKGSSDKICFGCELTGKCDPKIGCVKRSCNSPCKCSVGSCVKCNNWGLNCKPCSNQDDVAHREASADRNKSVANGPRCSTTLTAKVHVATLLFFPS